MRNPQLTTTDDPRTYPALEHADCDALIAALSSFAQSVRMAEWPHANLARYCEDIRRCGGLTAGRDGSWLGLCLLITHGDRSRLKVAGSQLQAWLETHAAAGLMGIRNELT